MIIFVSFQIVSMSLSFITFVGIPMPKQYLHVVSREHQELQAETYSVIAKHIRTALEPFLR